MRRSRRVSRSACQAGTPGSAITGGSCWRSISSTLATPARNAAPVSPASAAPVQPIGASRSSRIAAPSEVSVPAMLRKTVRRPKKRPRSRSGTRSPIQATQALLPITLATVLIATMARKRSSLVSRVASSVGSARSGKKVRREIPTAQSATALRLRAFVNQAAGRLITWAPERQRAQEADHRRARAQVERPAGDDGPGGAGGEDLGEGALRHRGVQRAAQRAAGGRAAGRVRGPGPARRSARGSRPGGIRRAAGSRTRRRCGRARPARRRHEALSREERIARLRPRTRREISRGIRGARVILRAASAGPARRSLSAD